MSEYIVSKIQNGNDTYKFKSAFQKEIAITAASSTTAQPNRYFKIGAIPTSNNSSTRPISFLVCIKNNRYLININPLYGVTDDNKVEVIKLSNNSATGSILTDIAYELSSTSAAGTMSVYLKVYANKVTSRISVTNISENVDIPFELSDLGKDDSTYSGTTTSAYFNAITNKGNIKSLQTQELSSPISIGGVSKSIVEDALNKLNTNGIYEYNMPSHETNGFVVVRFNFPVTSYFQTAIMMITLGFDSSVYYNTKNYLFDVCTDDGWIGRKLLLSDNYADINIPTGRDSNNKIWFAIPYNGFEYNKLTVRFLHNQGFSLTDELIDFVLVDDTNDKNDIITEIGGYILNDDKAYGIATYDSVKSASLNVINTNITNGTSHIVNRKYNNMPTGPYKDDKVHRIIGCYDTACESDGTTECYTTITGIGTTGVYMPWIIAASAFGQNRDNNKQYPVTITRIEYTQGSSAASQTMKVYFILENKIPNSQSSIEINKIFLKIDYLLISD